MTGASNKADKSPTCMFVPRVGWFSWSGVSESWVIMRGLR